MEAVVLREQSKLVVSLSLALGLLLAACSPPPAPNLNLGSGQQFVPQVVDFLDNVGLDPSMALDSNGNPAIVYVGVPQVLKPGEIPPSQPIGSPTLPGVLVATLENGVWTRAAVDEDVKDLTADDVTGTSVAVDSQDFLHVVWSTTKGIWYATNAAGDFTPEQIDKGPIAGPSIGVDATGTPWVAYYSGQNAYAATQKGSHWDVQRIAKSGSCTNCPPARTAVSLGGKGGAVVAFTDLDAQSPMVAWQSGKSWKTDEVEPGVGGFGISLAEEGSGVPHVAYYTTNGEVHEASSATPGRSSWKVEKVGTYAAAGDVQALATSIAIAQDGTQFVAWTDPNFGVVLASDQGGSFEPIETHGTVAGGTPAIAVSPDASHVYVAWYDTVNQDLQLGTYASGGALELAKPSPTPATPGETTSSAQPTLCSPGPKSLDVTAKGLAFLENCLAAPADQKFTIAFDNQDAGVMHNVEIIDKGPATNTSAKTLFQPPGGAGFTGPGVTKYNVDPLKAGTYFFFCAFHPTTMFGNFVVAKG
jgi:plastocyanin